MPTCRSPVCSAAVCAAVVPARPEAQVVQEADDVRHVSFRQALPDAGGVQQALAQDLQGQGT
jgi:hypothetical protein